MRHQKEETLILDELTLEESFENKNGQGVFQIVNEFDETKLLYVRVGLTQIGFVPIEDMVKFAEKIIELWKARRITKE